MAKIHQVFVGCPFLTAIRKNYDKLKADLEDESPLHIVLADTAAITSTDYLLEHITTLIRESAGRGGPHPLDRFSSQLRWNPVHDSSCFVC